MVGEVFGIRPWEMGRLTVREFAVINKYLTDRGE